MEKLLKEETTVSEPVQEIDINENRFPEDFCFQLTMEEYNSLRFQSGTSKKVEIGKVGRRYLPYVFTEQEIAMLSAVLRSDVAIQVSIRIMNTFVEPVGAKNATTEK